MGRRVFLRKMTAEAALEAWQQALSEWRIVGEDLVPTAAAIGRVTARAVTALRNAPEFASAAMDGIAVRAADTFGATERHPVIVPAAVVVEVNTGNPLPEGFDAVVMVEDLNRTDGGDYVLHRAVPPWHHVRQIGENAVRGTMLVPQGTVVSAAAAALFLSAGVLEVAVRRRPRVTVIPTGDELTPPTSPAPGKVPESNSTMLAALLEGWGAEATTTSIVADSPTAITAALGRALTDSDMVLVNAGSSAGTRDHAADVVQAMGELVVHGVAVRPGKPLLLGVVEGRPVAGLPGYPVAALVDMERFVRPLLAMVTGRPTRPRSTVEAVAGSTITSRLGDEEHVHGKLVLCGNQVCFHPLPRGAAALQSVVRADGTCVIPANVEGVAEGATVQVALSSTAPRLDRSVVAIGSHDLLLDVAADELRGSAPAIFLESLHVGSMGALRAVASSRAQVGGIHLLDPATGTYNETFLDRYLDGVPHALVHLCRREQGLVVPPGNPKGIRGLSDLVRDDVVFVNRQRGSGTRVLLDIRLAEAELPAAAVRGYDREETTHIAVAVRVANGFADCGLAVRAAAVALGMDFVPIDEERYDLLVDGRFFTTLPCRRLLETIASPAFRRRAEACGGYSLASAGDILRHTA